MPEIALEKLTDAISNCDGTKTACFICDRQSDQKNVVFQDGHWTLRHSAETKLLGYFLLESRRHLLDLSEANEAEAASYGPLLGRIMKAIREVVNSERVYTFSLGESVPHYHLHLIPKTQAVPRRYKARGIMQLPLEPAADPSLVEEACARIRRALRRS